MAKQVGIMEELRCSGGAGKGIVAVNPEPNKGLTSKIVDFLESTLVKIMYDTSSSRPQYYLSGSFSPVSDETPPTTDVILTVGSFPKCLNGEFVRVGPNPKFAPIAGYHLFDGDGMVHGLRIKDGKATYVSRFVKTSRLRQEEFFGGSKFAKIGDFVGLFGAFMFGLNVLRAKLKILDLSYGFGTANTALVYHDGKLLALHEGDKPYVLKVLEDGDLQTLGLIDYDKRLINSFTAHPKVDPITGEMFGFGYGQMPPYLSYKVVSKDGFMRDPVQITIPDSVMMHDFAITENYAIFMDLPMIFKPKEMVTKKKLAYFFDKCKKARFGVLPRYAKDELLIKWFDLPNCFIFHNANAWEEGDEIVLITCRVTDPDLNVVGGILDEELQHFVTELYEMRFDMKTGLAKQKKLSESAVDFPRVNESYIGRKHRYIYGTIMGGLGKITGIVKFDLHCEAEIGKTRIEVGGNVEGVYELGHGRYGSEAVFVPKHPGLASEEDDGYLIFFVHDENSGKSYVHVIYAKTMSSEPVAIVSLPHRVPPGFHALFVTEEQLKEQESV